MHHIAEFLMKKLGIKVEAFSADMKPLPEPEDNELIRLGRQCVCDGQESARVELLELISDLMRNGQAERVLDCCHRLLGEDSDPSSKVAAEPTELIYQARQSLMTTMG